MKLHSNIYFVLIALLLSSQFLAQCENEKHLTPPELSGGSGGGSDSDDNEDGETPEQGLPGYATGITVNSFTEKFSNGSQCLGYYAIVDFAANPKLSFNPQRLSARKPSAYFSDFKASQGGNPQIAINGGFFDSKLNSLSLLIDDNVVKSIALKDDYIWSTTPYTHFFPVRAALGQFTDGRFEAAWVYCVDDDNDRPYAFSSALGNNEKEKIFIPLGPTSRTAGGKRWQPQDAIGAGPMLVYNGENVAEENYWKEIFDCGGLSGLTRQPRTAIGATKEGKLVLVVCDGRKKRGSAGYTLPELAQKMIDLGCTVAINLDGGGSSTFVGKDGQVLNMPSDTAGTSLEGATIKERSVPTAVVIAES